MATEDTLLNQCLKHSRGTVFKSVSQSVTGLLQGLNDKISRTFDPYSRDNAMLVKKVAEHSAKFLEIS